MHLRLNTFCYAYHSIDRHVTCSFVFQADEHPNSASTANVSSSIDMAQSYKLAVAEKKVKHAESLALLTSQLHILAEQLKDKLQQVHSLEAKIMQHNEIIAHQRLAVSTAEDRASKAEKATEELKQVVNFHVKLWTTRESKLLGRLQSAEGEIAKLRSGLRISDNHNRRVEVPPLIMKASPTPAPATATSPAQAPTPPPKPGQTAGAMHNHASILAAIASKVRSASTTTTATSLPVIGVVPRLNLPQMGCPNSSKPAVGHSHYCTGLGCHRCACELHTNIMKEGSVCSSEASSNEEGG